MKSRSSIRALPPAVLFAVMSISNLPAQAPQGPPAHGAFGGVWVLNREKSELPGPANPVNIDGGGRGGRRGGAGFGGQGAGRAADIEQMQAQMEAMINYVRAALAASNRLTIVVREASVGITNADGATVTLQTDDKKVQGRAENGLLRIARRARWVASTLVSNIEIDLGPDIERRYELSPGGTELHISTTLRGGFGGPVAGPTRTILQVYERPLESGSVPESGAR